MLFKISFSIGSQVTTSSEVNSRGDGIAAKAEEIDGLFVDSEVELVETNSIKARDCYNIHEKQKYIDNDWN